ncbi:MAG: hypothetical protein ACRDQ7_00960 [Haloechinothrix sp.]
MTLTAERVRAARTEGYGAGYRLERSRPNPYAPPQVPVWLGPRTAAERARKARRERPAIILARVWLVAHRRGLADYARERGLRMMSDLND